MQGKEDPTRFYSGRNHNINCSINLIFFAAYNRRLFTDCIFREYRYNISSQSSTAGRLVDTFPGNAVCPSAAGGNADCARVRKRPRYCLRKLAVAGGNVAGRRAAVPYAEST